MKPAKFRFAPSPSGYIHPGNARSAIMNYVFSQSIGGKFLIRIDNTNSDKTSEEFIKKIYENLNWLKISEDEKYIQSERGEFYQNIFDLLKKSKKIYPCKEDFENLSHGSYVHHIRRHEIEEINPQKNENYSWRFEILNKKSSWNDLATGYEEYDLQKITGDPIVFRKNGSITYLLASVIDDILMEITHVIRGKDHVTNTAIQIEMINSIKQELKIDKYNEIDIKFCHLPLLSFEDGSKLSKRNNSLSIDHLKNIGILPMTINNYLMSIGTNQIFEYKDMNDMIDNFKKENFEDFIKNLGKSSPCFSQNTLFQLNQSILSKKSLNEIKSLWNTKIDEDQWNYIKNNIFLLSELNQWEDVFFNVDIDYRENLFKNEYVVKIFENDENNIKDFFKKILSLFPEKTDIEHLWDEWVVKIKNSTQKNGKEIFMPIRIALTGMEHGPKMNEILKLTSKEILNKRLKSIGDY